MLEKTLVEGDFSFEVVYRYAIGDNESFKMEPGFVNFQKISQGEKLATANGNPVLSQWNARIFMPLYQSQGQDGFFIVERC